MADRGGLPGREYQIFHASTGGSASTCSNRGELIMGHRESQRCQEETFHGLLALDVPPLRLGAMPQSPRTLFVSFSLPLGPKEQQEPPNASKGLLVPNAMSKWLFAFTLGPLEQAGEYSPVFLCLVSARHLSLYLQLSKSSSPVEQGFHRIWVPLSYSSHLESRGQSISVLSNPSA